MRYSTTYTVTKQMAENYWLYVDEQAPHKKWRSQRFPLHKRSPLHHTSLHRPYSTGIIIQDILSYNITLLHLQKLQSIQLP